MKKCELCKKEYVYSFHSACKYCFQCKMEVARQSSRNSRRNRVARQKRSRLGT